MDGRKDLYPTQRLRGMGGSTLTKVKSHKEIVTSPSIALIRRTLPFTDGWNFPVNVLCNSLIMYALNCVSCLLMFSMARNGLLPW